MFYLGNTCILQNSIFIPKTIKVTIIGQVLIVLRFLESLEIIIAIFCRSQVQIPNQFLPLDLLEDKKVKDLLLFSQYSFLNLKSSSLFKVSVTS